MRSPVLFTLASLVLAQGAFAQSKMPRRQIPPSVLTEVSQLQSRFESALAQDCHPEQCFSKGCVYVAHAVIDRPRSRSLPGLGGDPGPGSVEAQEFLTKASCSFTHEETVLPGDVSALTRRLASKVSTGWTVVSVEHQRLAPLPEYVQEAPAPIYGEEPEEESEPQPIELPPAPWSVGQGALQLWSTLLPHFYWMVGLILLTFTTMMLIWSWRRVGRDSIEDRMLLAELAREGGGESPEPEPSLPEEVDEQALFIAEQHELWTSKLNNMVKDGNEVEISTLIRQLLRADDLPLLAKAVLTFPDSFPAAFPEGGEVASAKLRLAEYLKTVDHEELPSDEAFYRALNRHALSAAVSCQADAEIVRSLQEDFGAAGLAGLINELSARPGALLFALTPVSEQQEIVRLLSDGQVAKMSDALLSSNRLDPKETTYLFSVLSAVRRGHAVPEPEPGQTITDRGSEFEAARALSVLLESLPASSQQELFSAALRRFSGNLPVWCQQIFFSDMLMALSEEARIDLFLDVDVQHLAAWLLSLDSSTSSALIESLPSSLRASVRSFSFASRQQQLELAEQGRQELIKAFAVQISRANMPFETVVYGARA